ncbi:MAG: hypothetical protein H6607_12290 [Flavobacteriales bacterium]|nr:hypothetical protein [Flavobacteriales bacterium]
MCISVAGFAQNDPPKKEPLKIIPEYRFNISYAKNLDVGVQHLETGFTTDLLNIFDKKLRFGFGVRMGAQYNQNLDFTTAHANLKSTPSSVDTMHISNAASVAFNLYGNVEFALRKRIAIGVNVDFIGISTGLKAKGQFKPGKESTNQGFEIKNNVEIYPTAANAFTLYNSKGCLYNQAYIRIEPSRKFGIRLGLAYLNQEFSTNESVGVHNAYRFEYNTWGFMAGITFNNFNEK